MTSNTFELFIHWQETAHLEGKVAQFSLLSASCVGQEHKTSSPQPLGADAAGERGDVWQRHQHFSDLWVLALLESASISWP